MHTERIVGLQLQQLLRERGTILRYTFTACLVKILLFFYLPERCNLSEDIRQSC